MNTSPQVARKTGSPIPVQVAKATKGTIKQLIAAEGLIKQSSEIDIRAKSDSKISSVKVQLGDVVSKGQVLVIVEAMKMEHRLLAPRDGVMADVSVVAGDQIEARAVVAKLEPDA